MKSKLFIQDVFVYGLNNFLIKVFAFIMIPIIVRLFSVSEFGVIEVMLSIVGFLALVYGMGYDVAMKKTVLIDNESNKIEDQLKSNFLFLLIWGGILTVASISFSKHLSFFIFGSYDYIKVFTWGIISCYLNSLIGLFLTLTRIEFKRIKFLTINVLKVFFEYSLIILLLLLVKSEAYYYFVAMVLVDFLLLLFLLTSHKKRFKGNYKKSIIKNIYIFGLPAMISGIGYWVFNMSDKIVLSHVTGSTYATGIYSMLIKMLSIYTFIMQSFQMALVPRAFQMYGEDPENFKSIIETIQNYSLAVFSIIAITNFAGLRLMLQVFATKDYLVGVSVAYPLVMAYIIYPLTSIASIGIYVTNKMKKLAPVVWIAAIINIVVNYLLINYIGILAASLSTLMAYVFIYIVYWKISCKALNWELKTGKLIINFILIAITIIGINYIIIGNVYLDLVIKLLLVVIYIVLLFVFKIIKYTELLSVVKTIFIKNNKALKSRF